MHMHMVEEESILRHAESIANGSGSLTEQVVIGTPGTVLDWLNRRRFLDPKKLCVFVLDEADIMISMQGHQDQSVRVHKYLHHFLFILNSYYFLQVLIGSGRGGRG